MAKQQKNKINKQRGPLLGLLSIAGAVAAFLCALVVLTAVVQFVMR